MGWLSAHIPHILGTLGIGGAGGAIVFRDAIGKAWDSWLADRKAAREERMAREGSGDKLAATMVQMFTQGLSTQHEDNKTLHAILDRVAAACERLAERQEEFNRKQDAQDSRIDRWERSRGIN